MTASGESREHPAKLPGLNALPEFDTAPQFDAIILAGGAARRLGGASKPDVEVAGRRLLDYALDATHSARRTVVVGPPGLVVPAGVRLTLEDPPLGGPVAGIAAGLSTLQLTAPERTSPGARPRDTSRLVLLLACDVPGAASTVPRLVRAMRGAEGTDGACLVDEEGHLQWLVGLYRRAALQAGFTRLEHNGGIRNAGVRNLLAQMPLARVPARKGEAGDVDTWRDVESQTLRVRPTE